MRIATAAKSVKLAMASIIFAGMAFLYCGCSSDAPKQDDGISPFTHGNVQLTIRKNETTQAEILEKFGPPNIATTDSSGCEIWSYQKHATVSKSSGERGYFTIIILGGRTGDSGFEQSQKTMTLIIKFDAAKKVSDFKSMSTSF